MLESRVVTEPIISTAQSLDAARLEADAAVLNDGYRINDTGKQYMNELAIMQNMPAGPEADFPAAVTTAKGVSCAPAFSEG
jgi:hypothetical protein